MVAQHNSNSLLKPNKNDNFVAQAVETTKGEAASRFHQSTGQLPEGSTFCSPEGEGRNQEI